MKNHKEQSPSGMYKLTKHCNRSYFHTQWA